MDLHIIVNSLFLFNKFDVKLKRINIYKSYSTVTVKDLEIKSKIEERSNELDIKLIIAKYGSYENYINSIENINIVDEEFILKNYPEYINDSKFIEFLMELEPLFRDHTEFVKKIYENLNSTNEKLEFLLANKDILSENKEIFDYVLQLNLALRKDMVKNFSTLFKNNNQFISKFLINFNKKMLSKNVDTVILNNIKDIKNKEEFEKIFKTINRVLIKDLKGDEDEIEYIGINDKVDAYGDKLRYLLLELFKLYEFCKFNSLKYFEETN